VIRRVRRKAQTFGQDVQDGDAPPEASSLKLDPEHIVKLYHDFIIPLTKEAEVTRSSAQSSSFAPPPLGITTSSLQ
jgi:hypothetical protein